jgi:hypothetical protein
MVQIPSIQSSVNNFTVATRQFINTFLDVINKIQTTTHIKIRNINETAPTFRLEKEKSDYLIDLKLSEVCKWWRLELACNFFFESLTDFNIKKYFLKMVLFYKRKKAHMGLKPKAQMSILKLKFRSNGLKIFC